MVYYCVNLARLQPPDSQSNTNPGVTAKLICDYDQNL